MSAGLASAPGPASVVELDMGGNRACIAEYYWSGPDAAAIVLLHDEGLDLDSTRELAVPLVQQGFSVLNLDLPGHGLSSGDYGDDTSLAIAAGALFVDPNGERGVGFIGVGATSAHLMRSRVQHSIGVVLIDPRSVPAGAPLGSVWRSTPSLFIVDPRDAHAEAAAEALSAQVKAWNLRCFVHREAASSDHDAVPRASTRMLHIRALSTKFLLEQSTYRHSRIHQLKDRA